jgi:hypothetical protein
MWWAPCWLAERLLFGGGNAKFSELAEPHSLVIDSTVYGFPTIFNPEDNPAIGMQTAYVCQVA